ncbi:MAG: hypothetical protein RL398_3499 [Planctomycetota bacterium]
MAKKHKHEEHVNHERWLVSFADMMTLLFALFVVLYAMGQADISKAQQLKNSVQWAFHIQGSGKTKDIGVFDQQRGGGETIAPAPLVTAQKGTMIEFLKDTLPEFEAVTGSSLEIVQTDDSVAIKSPLSDFFPAERTGPIPQDVQSWLEKVIVGALPFTSEIRIVIETPDLVIGRNPAGRPVTSVDLCVERLKVLDRLVKQLPDVRDHVVRPAWQTFQEKAGEPPANWEQRARLTIAFTDSVPVNKK